MLSSAIFIYYAMYCYVFIAKYREGGREEGTDFAWSYFAISSIRLAYSITDRTPPWRMLSLICICLVSAYLVLSFAVRLLFSLFTIFQFFLFRPFLCVVYMIAFSHALSYAFVMSRNTTCRSCFFYFLLWFIMLFSILMWSAVDFPACPPACASVVSISFLMRLLISLSNNFPILLVRVIPLSCLCIFLWFLLPTTQWILSHCSIFHLVLLDIFLLLFYLLWWLLHLVCCLDLCSFSFSAFFYTFV